jgi:hypothetical protein
VLVTPESGQQHPGAVRSLRPHAGIPREARSTFTATLPCLIALWALGGFYLSLGPSLASLMLQSKNLLWGGFVICLLMGCAAAASITLRTVDSYRAMRAGWATLMAGLRVTIAGIATTTPAVFLAGTAIAGWGFGLASLGAFRSLTALAPAEQRGRPDRHDLHRLLPRLRRARRHRTQHRDPRRAARNEPRIRRCARRPGRYRDRGPDRSRTPSKRRVKRRGQARPSAMPVHAPRLRGARYGVTDHRA